MEKQATKEKGRKAAFLSLGCKVNSYETDAMKQLFLEKGYEVVPFSEKADIYIVNTCTVTNIADRKSRQMLHRAKKKNLSSIIVAVGCYVQAAKEQLEAEQDIDVVIGNNQKGKIIEIVESYIDDNLQRETILDISQNVEYEELQIVNAGERTRAYIKIQDGCNQFCSYCIIPYARGRVRSRKEEDILREIERLAIKGYQEVVLTGIHLSSYGVDQENKDFVILEGKPLVALIEKIALIEGIKRIRLGSLEPRIISDKFVNRLAQIDKLCPHFHLSLQSGCDATLKRMNRKYSTEEYKKKCDILRKYFDYPAITTDVIVGFPGETEEEFLQTKEFIEKMQFAQMHIFKYSVRKGTKAEKMENQISDKEKAKRSEILFRVEKELREEYESNFYNKQENVLFEEEVTIEEKKYFIGHNERYMKFALLATSSKNKVLNQIVLVKTTDITIENSIFCVLR